MGEVISMNEALLTNTLNKFAARKCEAESLYDESDRWWQKNEKESDFWKLTDAEEELYKRLRHVDGLMNAIWKFLDELWAIETPSAEEKEAKDYLVKLYDEVHSVYRKFSELLKTARDRMVLVHALATEEEN